MNAAQVSPVTDADWARIQATGVFMEEDRARFVRLPPTRWELSRIVGRVVGVGAYAFDDTLYWVTVRVDDPELVDTNPEGMKRRLAAEFDVTSPPG